MFIADIGQNIVEEISPVTAGANLGGMLGRELCATSNRTVARTNARGDRSVTYPVVEYGQLDPLLQGNSAVIGGIVYRHNAIRQLTNLLIFGDNPSGEIFYVSADKLPATADRTRSAESCFDANGESKTLLELIKEKNAKQGKATGNARRSAIWRRARWSNLRVEQTRRHDSPARARRGEVVAKGADQRNASGR